MSAENEEFQISQEKEGNKLTVFLKGEINVATSKEFDDFINDNLEGVSELEFDLKEVDFVSSAGLRVFLNAQKIMDKQGSMLIRNMSEDVFNVFEMTGFSDVVNIV
ncbi:MAG: STAS domain-containing protein [Lachnospiraceae bacterium]|jgi:anti-sigma B factor antagonist|nr:STAS domain-containing protein [Lachnospiraceae bacterium]